MGAAIAGVGEHDDRVRDPRWERRTVRATAKGPHPAVNEGDVVGSRHDPRKIAQLRGRMVAQGCAVPRIVEALVDGFGLSRLEAHRLARGWTRPQAVEAVQASYTADGLRAPPLSAQRLWAWERKAGVRPGEDYLDRLCRVYETRPDQLGYGQDYAPPEPPADPPPTAYAGSLVGSLVAVVGEEDGTDRNEFLRAAGATGLAALLDRASGASVRLGRKLGASNLGPVTVEQLDLRVHDFAWRYNSAPLDALFAEVFAEHQEVERLLDGPQTLGQRRGLHRVAGHLSWLLGLLSFDLGDYPAARVHLLTAGQLAREVGDHTLIASARWMQSVTALWGGDFRAALGYAQDGQRYAAGDLRARLAAVCEGRAYARMGDRSGLADALRRAEQAMPSQPAGSGPDGLFMFTPGGLLLHMGNALMWLGEVEQAEPYARQSFAWYQAAPRALQDPGCQAQAQIISGVCLVRQGHPDEGIRLAGQSLAAGRTHVEPNLQLADELLAALSPAHRDLAAARDLAEQLRAIRTTPHGD